MSRVQELRRTAELKLARANRGEKLNRLDPFSTATHEAAHCVFHEAFGVTVNWATCMPYTYDGTYALGYVNTNADKVKLPAILHIVQTLAGDIAEWGLFSKESFEPGLISSSDGESLCKIMKDMGPTGEPANKTYERLAKDAHELVLASEQWIRAVAIELYARRKMTGDEIRVILHSTGFYEGGNPLVVFAEKSTKIAHRIIEFQKLREMRDQMVERYSLKEVEEIERRTQEYFDSLSGEQQEQLKQEFLNMLDAAQAA